MKVDFATFCYSGDAHRLHAPGQFKRQIESNGFKFNTIHVIYQCCDPANFGNSSFHDFEDVNIDIVMFSDINQILRDWNINLTGQYVSQTDKAHHWKYHVVNHLIAIEATNADYIVFADNDCWMVRQPVTAKNSRYRWVPWVEKGVEILQDRPEIFIVSPNDGEYQRVTRRFSQQMFLARVDEFRNADFNQPGWDGNVNIPGGPMPEYWAMLEGRMELHCRVTDQYRYVLGPEYRYWHHNRLNEDDLFETDMSRY